MQVSSGVVAEVISIACQFRGRSRGHLHCRSVRVVDSRCLFTLTACHCTLRITKCPQIRDMHSTKYKHLHVIKYNYHVLLTMYSLRIVLTLSDFLFETKMCPQEIPLFIRNQYSDIARKRSNTTAIIVRVKI